MGTSTRWYHAAAFQEAFRDLPVQPWSGVDESLQIELGRAGVVYANTGSLRALSAIVAGLPIPDGEVSSASGKRRVDAITRETTARERAEFCADLTRIAEFNDLTGDQDADKRDYVQRVFALDAMLVRAEREGQISAKITCRGMRLIAQGPDGGLDPALWMIRGMLYLPPFVGDLRRCRWKDCEAPYFLLGDRPRKRGAQLSPFFCSAKHATAHHDASRGERPRSIPKKPTARKPK